MKTSVSLKKKLVIFSVGSLACFWLVTELLINQMGSSQKELILKGFYSFARSDRKSVV